MSLLTSPMVGKGERCQVGFYRDGLPFSGANTEKVASLVLKELGKEKNKEQDPFS